MSNIPAETGATFSTCGRYRYRLWRIWNKGLPTVLFIMLNPSSADATKNDPTIRRCINFAIAWGNAGMESYFGLFSLSRNIFLP